MPSAVVINCMGLSHSISLTLFAASFEMSIYLSRLMAVTTEFGRCCASVMNCMLPAGKGGLLAGMVNSSSDGGWSMIGLAGGDGARCGGNLLLSLAMISS